MYCLPSRAVIFSCRQNEDNSGFLLLRVFQYRLPSELTDNASIISVATYHHEVVSSSHLARTAVLLKYLIDVFAFNLNPFFFKTIVKINNSVVVILTTTELYHATVILGTEMNRNVSFQLSIRRIVSGLFFDCLDNLCRHPTYDGVGRNILVDYSSCCYN